MEGVEKRGREREEGREEVEGMMIKRDRRREGVDEERNFGLVDLLRQFLT